MPWNPSRYPEDWKTISTRVKIRAGFRCEHCGHPHDPEHGYTLTVHHLDGDPANCDPNNLVALCQRCHLAIQARYRVGQLWLPIVEPPAWAVRRGLA